MPGKGDAHTVCVTFQSYAPLQGLISWGLWSCVNKQHTKNSVCMVFMVFELSSNLL